MNAPAAEPLHLAVDFAAPTGAVHGGATGMLYGLGDPGVPTSALIAGARPRTVAQKAPAGLQHPNGDALATSAQFFAAGGEEMLVYMQDVYSEWPYEQLGIEHYLAEVVKMVTTVAEAAGPDIGKFSWVPFNEPDWIWYPDWEKHREAFFADWLAVHRAIRAILPQARIVGPNEMDYNHQRLADFLAWAAANDVLPDVVTWHELRPQALDEYRAHHADYRQMEASLALAPLPININEYGNRRDTSNPAQLIQWITMFEDTKVDADMAYWTFAGNLDDHTVGSGEANGGWWLLKWYADLTGETVRVSPPAPSTIDTLQAIATLDAGRREATVLLGGGSGEACAVDVTGLPSGIFGDLVDVTVARVSWSGYEGPALALPVLSRSRQSVRDGALSVLIEGGDPMAAYQVRITPPERAVDTVSAVWTARYEAEQAELTGAARVVDQKGDPQTYASSAGTQKYATSGGFDVCGLAGAGSAVTFAVDVPAGGDHTLSVFYGTSREPGQLLLQVDDEPERTLSLAATLRLQYRARLDVELTLTAGSHRIALRNPIAAAPTTVGSETVASDTAEPAPEAVDALDNGAGEVADICLDRIDLTQAMPQRWTYPARTARLSHGATLRPGDSNRPAAAAALTAGGVVSFFVAVAEDGYHDLITDFTFPTGENAAALRITVNDRLVQAAEVTAHGDWQASARVHLAKGITTVQLRADEARADLHVSSLSVIRTASADSATIAVAAADASLSGGATIVADPFAVGGHYVQDGGCVRDGGSAESAITLGPEFTRIPGAFNLTVSYAHAEQNTASHYNTDVINRYANISESGGLNVRAIFKHSYAWNNFWTAVVPLDLLTPDGALTISNSIEDAAPNIDYLALSPLVLATTVEHISSEHHPQ